MFEQYRTVRWAVLSFIGVVGCSAPPTSKTRSAQSVLITLEEVMRHPAVDGFAPVVIADGSRTASTVMSEARALESTQRALATPGILPASRGAQHEFTVARTLVTQNAAVVKLQQHYQRVPVWGSEVILKIEDDQVVAVSGRLLLQAPEESLQASELRTLV